MKNKILLIVPTRGRHDNVNRLVKSINETTSIVNICLVIDEDDKPYPEYNNVMYEVLPFTNIVNKINYVALKYLSEYKFFGFVGDDVVCKTPKWDVALTLPLMNRVGVSYGNDLLQGVKLPNNVILNSDIVKSLGYMCPPELKHFYIDNFWKDLGAELGVLCYFEQYILEHMHPLNKKSNLDDTYNLGWKNLENDMLAYEKYKSDRFLSDVQKVKQLTL